MKKSNSIILMLSMSMLLSFFAGCKKDDSAQAGEAESKSTAVAVKTQKAAERVFERRVELSGNVLAVDSAVVSARIAGVVDKIYVDEGDKVSTGQTGLFQTDKLTLQKRHQNALKLVAVAKATLAASEAVVNRVQTDLYKAKLDVARYERLIKSEAITQNDLELQQSRVKQLEASLAEAVAGVALAKARVDQADNDVEIAAKDMSDALVLSPIDGKVSDKFIEAGELAEVGTPVLKIVDLSSVEVSAYLPELYYSDVTVAKTIAHISCGGQDLGEFPVSYKSPVVDPQLRTFEIKVLLDPAPEMVVPGRLVKLAVVLESRKGLGVPAGAILSRAGNDVVFIADAGKVHQVAIKGGLESDGFVLISGDKISAGQDIVTVGQRFCNDGSAVRIIGEAN